MEQKMRTLIITLTLVLLVFSPNIAETPGYQFKLKQADESPVKSAAKPVSRGGQLPDQSPGRYIGTFEATAYNLTTNRTATGKRPRVGVVAVDPEVIPLGTRVYVEGYGPAVAEDTGRVIKGRKLDVWLPGDKAWEWGRRR